MDSKSDSLLLSYKDNPELKAALADATPGDEIELCVTVTVRANDAESFDAMIDKVELMDEEMDEKSEEKAGDYAADEDDSELDDPALVIIARKNGGK